MLDKYVRKSNNNNRNRDNENNETVNSYLEIEVGQPEYEISLTSTKYRWLIDALWILLDTASTVTIFCNAIYLRNIRKAKQATTIHTSGGTIVATLEGYLPFLRRWVAYHPDCLGNILSFRDVLDVHHVSLNSRQSRSFIVHCLHGDSGRVTKKVHFRPSGTGLFYFDPVVDYNRTFKRFPESLNSLSVSSNSSSNSEDGNVEVLNNQVEVKANTLEENLKAFSARQRTGIEKAREVYVEVGRPSNDKFLRIVKYRQLPNIPISEEDAKNMITA